MQAFITNGGNWSTVALALDYLDIMTYDMHGQFDVKPILPLIILRVFYPMQVSHHYTNDVFNHYTVAAAIADFIETQNVPANKIIMGIPAYMRIEAAAVPITDTNKGLYLTLASAGQQPGGESGSGGSTDYKCIINKNYCWGGFSFSNSLVYVPANLSGQGLGALEKTPWAYDKSQNWFMSFDDNKSAQYKGQWAAQQGLAGFMIWEIDGDIPKTDPNYQQTSVIYNAWQGLMNPSGAK